MHVSISPPVGRDGPAGTDPGRATLVAVRGSRTTRAGQCGGGGKAGSGQDKAHAPERVRGSCAEISHTRPPDNTREHTSTRFALRQPGSNPDCGKNRQRDSASDPTPKPWAAHPITAIFDIPWQPAQPRFREPDPLSSPDTGFQHFAILKLRARKLNKKPRPILSLRTCLPSEHPSGVASHFGPNFFERDSLETTRWLCSACHASCPQALEHRHADVRTSQR